MAVCGRSLSEGGGWRTGGSGEDSVRNGSEMVNSEKSVKNHEKSSERHIYTPLYPFFSIFSEFLGIWENSLARRVLATGARNETYSAFIHGLKWS
jgi:hypothetical protein